MTDAVMLGWYGVEELAAVVLGGIMFTVIFLVCSGFAMAVIPLAASAAGAGRTWRVRRLVRMGIWISMLFGMLAVIPMWNSESIFVAIGQKPGTAALAGDYLRIALWGIFPALMIMALKSFFLALVRPQIVLTSTVVGALLNVLANHILIFGNWGAPELGLIGAAIASVVSQSFSLLVMIGYLLAVREFREYALFSRWWKPEWAAFSEVFRLGWPVGATLLAEVGFFGVSAIMMGWVDTVTLAAHGIAIEITAMVFMVYLGLSNAGTVQLGRAVGAADHSGLVEVTKSVIVLTILSVIVVVAVFLLVPEILVNAFLDKDDPKSADVAAVALVLMRLSAMFQLADALQVVALGLLRALQDTRVPMIVATVSYMAVGVPTSYILAFVFGFGGPGIWIGFVVGLGLAASLLLIRFRFRLAAVISEL